MSEFFFYSSDYSGKTSKQWIFCILALLFDKLFQVRLVQINVNGCPAGLGNWPRRVKTPCRVWEKRYCENMKKPATSVSFHDPKFHEMTIQHQRFLKSIIITASPTAFKTPYSIGESVGTGRLQPKTISKLQILAVRQYQRIRFLCLSN